MRHSFEILQSNFNNDISGTLLIKIATIVSFVQFLPFLLLSGSHSGFEGIQYSFLPLLQFFGDFWLPINFLWEFGWQTPLAHGAWTFPLNWVAQYTGLKIYFFCYYFFHYFVCTFGFLLLAKKHGVNYFVVVAFSIIINNLPPQGWYIFIHDAPAVIATMQMVPILIWGATTLFTSQRISYLSIISLSAIASYTVTSGHPGMLFPFFLPSFIIIFIHLLTHRETINPLSVLIFTFITSVLCFPKMFIYFETTQSTEMARVVYENFNPARIENYLLNALFPLYLWDVNIFDRPGLIITNLYRDTRYLPILWIPILLSLFFKRGFVFILLSFFSIVGLMYLDTKHVNFYSSGVNHWVEGGYLLFFISLVCFCKFKPSRISYTAIFIISFFSVMLSWSQQTIFRKFTPSFYEHGIFDKSSMRPLNNFDNSTQRVIFTKFGESALRRKKYFYRNSNVFYSTMFAPSGIANISMIGKGTHSEPISKSWRSLYGLIWYEKMYDAPLPSLKQRCFAKAHGIDATIDFTKSDQPTHKDAQKIATSRKGIMQAFYTGSAGCIPTSFEKSIISGKKFLPIMLQPNTQFELNKDHVILTCKNCTTSDFWIPVRYQENLKVMLNDSNIASEYFDCSGFVCLSSLGPYKLKKIKITSKLTAFDIYLRTSIIAGSLGLCLSILFFIRRFLNE